MTSEFYQGPLPSPRVLQGFEEVVPGSAAMIMQNYDAQAKHRREMESFALKWENVRAICGIIAAFLITIVVVIVSYQSIINGNVIEGTLLAGINLALLIGAFIYGTRSRREERLERTKLMAETAHRSDAA